MCTEHRRRTTRRSLLKATAAAALLPLQSRANLFDTLLPSRTPSHAIPDTIPGTIVGASAQRGHRVRDNIATAPAQANDVDIVIVGGGISGLIAAWRLKKSGIDNFVVLELEDIVGGNSRSGSNHRSAYPWGAHYVPLPDKSLTTVIEVFEDIGIVTGRDANGEPIFDDYAICAAPQERLKLHGRWQHGSLPQLGVTDADQAEYQRFFSRMADLRNTVGSDGNPAFALPVDHSSQDASLRELDTISMAQFLARNNLRSPQLHWYVDYCCRDDFGIGIDKVSAWAGIHYFAARKHHSREYSGQVLTWPQGNGYIVQQLAMRLDGHLRTDATVLAVDDDSTTVTVDCIDSHMATQRYRAKHVIFAAPRFVAAHVVKSMRANPPAYLAQMHYAPWVVANVSLKRAPQGNGAPLSWDNVSRDSRSLGYVVASHQSVATAQQGTVLTWYMPLDHADPASARKQALDTTHAQWADIVAADLEAMHRNIRADIESIDVCVWGHAMIAPVTGFVFSSARAQMQRHGANVSFAHTDMSGMSLFEEAVYRGDAAAQRAMTSLRQLSRGNTA